MDIIFECSHCKQELSIDEVGAGSTLECPACHQSVTVPAAGRSATPEAAPEPAHATEHAHAPLFAPAGTVINAMASSAGAKENKHFVVPVHAGPTEMLIAKSLPTLEVAAKETDRRTRVKSFRHSDHVEVGKDHFDEHVNDWLGKVGDENIVQISTFSYTHQELASRAWVTDYGILVVYKG